MLEDETYWFLVADFDKETRCQRATAYLETNRDWVEPSVGLRCGYRIFRQTNQTHKTKPTNRTLACSSKWLKRESVLKPMQARRETVKSVDLIPMFF